MKDDLAHEAVLVCDRVATDLHRCIVCLEDINKSRPLVTCRACFSRSKLTWRSHVACWTNWEPQTCFFCDKYLVRFYSSKQKRAVRRYRMKRLHAWTDCVMALLLMLFFSGVLSMCLLLHAGISILVLHNDGDRNRFLSCVLVFVALLVRLHLKKLLNGLIRSEYRIKFRVRRMIRNAL